MTSKEIIKNHIDSLMEQIEIEKKLNTGLDVYCEIEITRYNQVLKDLEDYEELKKIMRTPIQDIMKRLKLLEVLKENIKTIDYCIFNDKIVIYLPVNYREQLKEWLDSEKDNR